MNLSTCKFCRRFSLQRDAEWYDELLYCDDALLVVSALGPFSEGYVMIVTDPHYRSFGRVPASMLTDAIELLGRVRTTISDVYGSAVVFEHGPGLASRGGSCIDHAHWHVMPSVDGLIPTVVQENDLRSMPASKLAQLSHDPYLFIADSHDSYGGIVEALPSQYIRRVYAQLLGKRHEWNYMRFPRLDVVKRTISRLQQHTDEWLDNEC